MFPPCFLHNPSMFPPCSLLGLVFPCGGLNRHFHYVAQQLSWTEAQRFCRESFTDLATLDGPDQQAEARKVVPNGMFWIGLSDGNWMWTQSGQELSESSSFVRWADGEPGIGQCAVISAHGLWAARSCTEKQQVVCYTGESRSILKGGSSGLRPRSGCRGFPFKQN
uniref:C-type lectin domain-containing protein n=1 Tax=Myripristis murdjan TaxID=586833 RepID=A0A667ZUW2_9TELE